MLYSNDHCHFCNVGLVKSDNNLAEFTKYCKNKKCASRYSITAVGSGYVVTFRVKDYYFQMFNNVFDETKEVLEIVGPKEEILSIPECRLITLDNYLEEVARARNLQTFK